MGFLTDIILCFLCPKMNGQIRGCPIQKTHVIVQPRNFDPIQKTHVKGGAAQLWGAPELIESKKMNIK